MYLGQEHINLNIKKQKRNIQDGKLAPVKEEINIRLKHLVQEIIIPAEI